MVYLAYDTESTLKARYLKILSYTQRRYVCHFITMPKSVIH